MKFGQALESYFSYFSTKTYVVGTQKNRLNKTVLLSTQNICLDYWVKKTIAFLRSIFLLNWAYAVSRELVGCIWVSTRDLGILIAYAQICLIKAHADLSSKA